MAKGFTKSRQVPADCNNLKIESEPRLNGTGLKKSFPGVVNLKNIFTVISLKRSFPDVGLKKDFPGVDYFAFVFTSLKRSFPGVDNLEPGSGSTLGFTIPEVDSKMIPGVDNHGWSNFLVEMTPKSTVESL